MTTARLPREPLRIALRTVLRLRVEGAQHPRTARPAIYLARFASPLDALLPRPAAIATTGPRAGALVGGRRP